MGDASAGADALQPGVVREATPVDSGGGDPAERPDAGHRRAAVWSSWVSIRSPPAPPVPATSVPRGEPVKNTEVSRC